MNFRRFRQFHQTVAPFVILPLSITILTGVTYRLTRSWFGLTRDQVHWLMVLHEGEYLGQWGEPIYVLLNGLGALWMLVTGSVMVWQNFSRGWRRGPAQASQSQANSSQANPSQANSSLAKPAQLRSPVEELQADAAQANPSEASSSEASPSDLTG